MKKILVTGKNSYAGRKFVERLEGKNSSWIVDGISVRDDDWKRLDFSEYDAIYHVAAIVHLKEKASREKDYYRVNSQLPYEIALKAKKEGVKTFVFLSSIAVYGLIGEIGKDVIITMDTEENPVTLNGKSKLVAEQNLKPLQSEDFDVVLMRIPLIYGKDCPGNYTSLSNLTKKIGVFPSVRNERSMVYIDHLSDMVEHVIERNLHGTLLINNPNNFETLDLVKKIAKAHNKKLIESNLLGFFIKKIGNNFSVLKKMFGTVYFKIDDTEIPGFRYSEINFEQSIRKSEGKETEVN